MVRKHISKPAEAILESKKKKDIKSSLVYLLLSSVLMALAGSIATAKISIQTSMIVGVGMFLMIFIGSLIIGWLIQLIATTLGGKGGYKEGLTAITNALVVPSIGAVAVAIFSYVPFLGIPLIFLTLAVSLSIGIAVFYRSIKELFSTDMITAFIVVSILAIALIIALLGTVLSVPTWLNASAFRFV
ncbi:MAG: YIP1 family protein [Candidatus Aenigmarchaeota archaeon]|nr:YIP1 family protein [Candidatus Aenigmarchaeota archaeon]